MRILPVIAAVAQANQASPSLNHAVEFAGQHNICGMIKQNHNGTMSEEITLEPEETCIYRVRGDNKHMIELINVHLDLDCEDGEAWMFTDDDAFGPFCHDKRKRRGAYTEIDAMHGQNFNSKEVDMVFRNGQRARFSFGFNFEFELLPGLPRQSNGGGMCSWKHIKSSNAAFYTHKDATSNPEQAMAIWTELTESMYNFQCYFDKFRNQCNGQAPVQVSCSILDWSDDCKGMIGRLEAVVAAQCGVCSGSGICSEWYSLISQLTHLSGGGGAYGPVVTPAPCDEDQCANGYNDCNAYATCTNECHGFTCTCIEGYDGDGKTCKGNCDEDQCQTDVCGEYATCTDKCGGYECHCDEGYHMDDGDCVITCNDDSCADVGCGVFATCNAECLTHTCECDAGYEMVDLTCTELCDNNQCLDSMSCPQFSTCNNLCQEWECICDAGYKKVDNTCVEICDSDICSETDCGENALCESDCNNATCHCMAGYQMINEKCEIICDVNPCADNSCGSFSTCSNNCKDHTCGCQDGYQMVGGVCEMICDANPCADNTCGPFSTCSNNCKDYTCGCQDGYEMVGGVCEIICDANPCEVHICGPFSTCSPQCKGSTCVCDAGYTMVGGQCKPDCNENVCQTNTCTAHQRCVAGCEDYTCKCKANYIPVSPGSDECKHEDPCHEVVCQKHASCNNGVCDCKNGYFNKDGECIEKINECIMGTDNCPDYATCTDTLFGFTCECHAGYRDTSDLEDGTECTHPYYTETGQCNLAEYSAFTDKKFAKVSYGTSYDHISAIHFWSKITAQLTHLGQENERVAMCDKEAGVVGCKLIDYTKDATACDWAHTLETVVNEVKTLCNDDWISMYAGYLNNLRTATCDEPNDCASGIHNCDIYATCTPKNAQYGNKFSGFTCNCNEEYYGNGRSCAPLVNECDLGAHKCASDAICGDTKNGYTCTCKIGYVGSGYVCRIPVDECALGTHDCSVFATCTDLDNGYTCKCKAKEGYIGNGKQCTGPADECHDGSHTCHDTTDCVNSLAGYSCICKTGYSGDPKRGCWPPLTCPWNASYASDNYVSYEGDFENGLCSLKYIKVCTEDLYDDLFGYGMKVCSKKNAYTQFQLFTNELFQMGKTYEKKYGTATSHFVPVERYGSECSIDSGAVPCNLIDFHFDEYDTVEELAMNLFNRVKALYEHVFQQCDPVYKATWEGWLARYYNALICPVNECNDPALYSCRENSSCVDRKMGYECVCDKHYENTFDEFGDVDSCVEIDYCVDAQLCGLYSTCTDLHPGYSCACHSGYYLKKGRCYPHDPCLTDNGGCHLHGTCTSQIVGYEANHQCRCNQGYEGDGFTCIKIDSCKQNNCEINADCIPYAQVITEADYNCKCKTGYIGNGFICEVYVDPCLNHAACGVNEEHYRPTNSYGLQSCECDCKPLYHRVNGQCEIKDKCSIIQCDEGYKCINNGECVLIPTDPCAQCDKYASCKVMGYPPAKRCACDAPYVGDGFTCTMGKSCAKPCRAPSKCHDGKCMCNPGYWFSWANSSCNDVNECKPNKQGQLFSNCNTYATCKNTIGGFSCTCNTGYTGDGVTCVKKQAGGQYVGTPEGSYVSDVKLPTLNSFSSGNFDSTSHNSISVYSMISTGQCSLMGFEWANLSNFMGKMKWSQNVVTNSQYVSSLLKEFQFLGKSALARAGPTCNLKLAGIVPCKLLFFPETDHRCELVRRLEPVFTEVSKNCNDAWSQKYGSMINYLLQHNQSGKGGVACPNPEMLP